VSDAEWSIIGVLLPSERGRKARPSHDNRRFLNGMLHVLRVVRGHFQAAGAKEGLARKALVEATAALRAKSTPAVTVRNALLASS
jgi:hypothetical protein